MKRVIPIIIAIVFLAGCASFNPKREVVPSPEGVVFTSTYPKMKIQLSKDFQFVGEMESSGMINANPAAISRRVKTERYGFCLANSEKAVIIQLRTLKSEYGYWRSYEPGCESIKINGKKWYLKEGKVSPGWKWREYMEKKGYDIKNEYVYKVFFRMPHYHGKFAVYVYYYTDPGVTPDFENDIRFLN